MGLMDKVFGKKEEELKEKAEQNQGQALQGKYSEECALCGGSGTDKKWMGQYWHKKCLRKSKKMAKGMI